MKLFIGPGVNDYQRCNDAYFDYISISNEYINLLVIEAFRFFYDILDDLYTENNEQYLKLVFDEFFVDRFGVEGCKQKIRAVYDMLCSSSVFNYRCPVHEYILYHIMENMNDWCNDDCEEDLDNDGFFSELAVFVN